MFKKIGIVVCVHASSNACCEDNEFYIPAQCLVVPPPKVSSSPFFFFLFSYVVVCDFSSGGSGDDKDLWFGWQGIGMVLWCIGTCKAMKDCVGGLSRWVPMFIRNVHFAKQRERKCCVFVVSSCSDVFGGDVCTYGE